MKKKYIIFILSSILLMACVNGSYKDDSGLYGFGDQNEIDLIEINDVFYEALIDSFCRTYYDRKLPGFYVNDSLHVTSVSIKDTHTVEVRGTHSFKGRDFLITQEQYDNRGFVATVYYSGSYEYLINFSRRLERPWPLGPGEWKYTGELPLIFRYVPHRTKLNQQY